MSESTKFFGDWSPSLLDNWGRKKTPFEEMCDDFDIVHDDMISENEILIASYGGTSYDGDAFVLFERGGTLYEVHGAHCSCNGLEGQWEPEETTAEAIALRFKEKGYFFSDHPANAIERLKEILIERGASI